MSSILFVLSKFNFLQLRICEITMKDFRSIRNHDEFDNVKLISLCFKINYLFINTARNVHNYFDILYRRNTRLIVLGIFFY